MKTITHIILYGLAMLAGMNTKAQTFGLGTSAPSELLHLYKTGDPAIRFQSSSSGSSNTGPSNPGTLANDAGVGTVAWSSTGNAATSNDAYATAASGTSQYLKATNFGFAVPAGATIDGIKVEIEKKRTADQSVALLDAWASSTGAFSFTNSAGSNRVLVLVVGMEEASVQDLTAVTYGGIAMMQAVEISVTIASPSYNRMEIWYLDESGLAAAGTGSKAFAFTWSSTPTDVMYIAATFQYVNQRAPLVGTGSNQGSANPLSVSSALSVAAGDMVVAGGISGNSGTYTENSGTYTEGQDFTSGATATTASYYKSISAAGTESPSVNFSGAVNRQGVACIVLKAGQSCADNSVKIVKGGTISGTEKADSSAWATSDAYTTYGGTSDMWGVSWTESDINSSTFGVAVSALPSNATASIDHIRITVYYTTAASMINFAAGIDQSDAGKFKISGSSALGASDRLIIDASGNVGIGTNPSTALHVSGTIRGSVIQATTAGAGAFQYNTSSNMTVPDYVFDKYFDKKSKENPVYSMMTLEDLEAYIARNRHLPRVPSRREIETDGIINTQAMSMIILEKIEELAIYIIEQDKLIDEQDTLIELLENQNKNLLQMADQCRQAEQCLKQTRKSIKNKNK